VGKQGGVGVERYTNELLDSWVGREVFVSCLVGPDVGDEYLEAVTKEPRSIGQQVLHSMIGLYVLEGYDQVGVTLSLIFDAEDRPSSPFFVPWGAVIRLEFPGQRGGTAGD
jgi:hypothetical protein